MAELVRLQICVELDDTWAWVAPGPERQQVVAAGALEAIKDAHVTDEGAMVVPAPVQVPQPLHPTAGPTRTMAQRLAKVEKDVHEIRGALGEQREMMSQAGVRLGEACGLGVIARGDYGSWKGKEISIGMDNPNITMEEYIRLEEEKAHRHGKVYNWETAKYGKIWYDEDVHDLRSVETEFLTIVFNDELSSEKILSCEPTVSNLNNNEIDFRILFDEFDDEDYTVIFDKNSFSYNIIYVNDLKTDSENDNEKVNMPSFPSPEPKVSCFDDLDFFKDFENEFPAIVYNDALTSKSDFLTEPTLSPQHIDEFDLKDEI
ncbi:hypothetical protein Tco_0402074 [Tanacetum coccineum]